MTWNPRYVQWARALGMTPEQAEAADKAGDIEFANFFTIWMGKRWDEFYEKHPECVMRCPCAACGEHVYRGINNAHEKFDAWLPGRVAELLGEA